MIGFKLSLKRHKVDNPGKKFRSKVCQVLFNARFRIIFRESYKREARKRKVMQDLCNDRILRNLPLLSYNKETMERK